METKLRRLVLLLLIVAGLGAVEYVTSIDVPGLDLKKMETVVTEAVDVPGIGDVVERLPADVAPQSSSAAGEVEGPHVRVVSWNLYNFGRTKDDREIAVAAETLRDFDLVAVQEVVTSPPGAQAVAKLDAALDRTGAAWDYRISNPTTGDGTERYAFLWKPSRVRLVGQAWLEPSLAAPIDREPYLARFEHRKTGQRFLVASLHAVPTSKDPGREVKRLVGVHQQYEADHVVLLGDFNLGEDDVAFEGLRRLGYRAVLDNQRTSLRYKRTPGPDGHLANAYDNVFLESGALRVARGGVLDFTTQFSSLKEARSLSDHLPVFVDVQWTAPPPATPQRTGAEGEGAFGSEITCRIVNGGCPATSDVDSDRLDRPAGPVRTTGLKKSTEDGSVLGPPGRGMPYVGPLPAPTLGRKGPPGHNHCGIRMLTSTLILCHNSGCSHGGVPQKNCGARQSVRNRPRATAISDPRPARRGARGRRIRFVRPRRPGRR